MDNQSLCTELWNKSFIKNKRLLRAFLAIDRRYFVPKLYQKYSYFDEALPIGYNQTISQPSTVAFMLTLLNVKAGQRILDIGSGSGWTSALLGFLVGKNGKIYGVERVKKLIKFSRQNLKKINYTWVKIYTNQKILGLPHFAPYDRILVSASAQEFPQVLIKQLKIRGIMVIPIIDTIYKITKTNTDDLIIEEFPGFAFVPLV